MPSREEAGGRDRIESLWSQCGERDRGERDNEQRKAEAILQNWVTASSEGKRDGINLGAGLEEEFAKRDRRLSLTFWLPNDEGHQMGLHSQKGIGAEVGSMSSMHLDRYHG